MNGSVCCFRSKVEVIRGRRRDVEVCSGVWGTGALAGGVHIKTREGRKILVIGSCFLAMEGMLQALATAGNNGADWFLGICAEPRGLVIIEGLALGLLMVLGGIRRELCLERRGLWVVEGGIWAQGFGFGSSFVAGLESSAQQCGFAKGAAATSCSALRHYGGHSAAGSFARTVWHARTELGVIVLHVSV